MLGLRQQVSRDVGGVGAVVRQDRDLARPGDAVDVDGAVHLAFRQRDEDVPRSADFIDRGDRGRAIGQSRDGLGPADPVDFVDAGFRRGDENVRVDPFPSAGRRRRDHHDLRHAGHLRRDHVHEHRGRIRRLAAGHVHADPFKRAEYLAEQAAVRL
ncbi:hypothetical protein D1872_241130 [compost metagenome]